VSTGNLDAGFGRQVEVNLVLAASWRRREREKDLVRVEGSKNAKHEVDEEEENEEPSPRNLRDLLKVWHCNE
jgi:hypothetical protein